MEKEPIWCAQMLRQQGGAVANGVASGEALCALFTGSGVGVATPPLLVPTIDHLTALLEGPRSAPYKSALLELLLIMPCRRARTPHTSSCHPKPLAALTPAIFVISTIVCAVRYPGLQFDSLYPIHWLLLLLLPSVTSHCKCIQPLLQGVYS